MTWVELIRKFVADFPKAHADITRLLNRNRIFVDRTKGIGVLTKEDAINWSCTGPVARASGVVRDLRKDEPYLAYKELAGSFKVVCGEGRRLLQPLPRPHGRDERVANIIKAAVENLPGGPVNVDVEDKLTIPDKNATYRSIEGLIQHFELFMWNRRWETPVEEVYGATGDRERRTRASTWWPTACGKAFRARTRPPSFIHFAVFPLHDGRPPDQRRARGAREPEHHRGGVGS